MKFLFLTIFFFVILIPLVLGIVLPIYKSHNKATAGIINYDSTMRKFIYKVNTSKEDVINLLKIKNDADELSCTVDCERSVISFVECGSNREYYFQVLECKDFSVLRLEQVALIGMQSHVPYKLNAFMVSKLHAEVIPFSQYGF